MKVLWTLLFASLAFAQPPSPAPAAGKDPKAPTDPGIPVTSQLVINKCSACHHKDDKGNLTRISWERTTPEGWQQAIKRMVRLNGLTLTPDEARQIVKYLSNHHGLAPEEAKPVMYIAEHRMIDEKIPSPVVQNTCMICHAIGRAASWRRTKQEWSLLVDMHAGYFPVVEFQGFRSFPRPADAPPLPPGTDTRQPSDQSIDYLAKTYGLQSPEWSAWQARMRAPKLAGRWLISATMTGKGKFVGEMTVEKSAATDDEFTTNITLHSVRDGSTWKRQGKALIYTGYAWRGRSTSTSDSVKEMREAMWVAPDQNSAEGRWFWGAYDESGFDVTLQRAGEATQVMGTDRTALKAGSTGVKVRILGDRFPTGLTADDFDFGSGVTVKRVVGSSVNDATVEVDVDAKAIAGKRDVSVRRAVLPNALAVYEKVDYIRVSPDSALARLGGTTHPKGFQQFEAVGYTNGPDGKPNTPDDIDLGPVDAEFSIEEFHAVYGDDDKDFIGTLSKDGYFTPASEGPNPKRQHGRNNYGDVWVVATAKNEKDKEGKPLVGKSYLVVTVPLYVVWDQPEIAQ
ncbi:MAG: quinohemoprotein amine dehydrogenase subunit alpha [Bryobacteraceae bacterium]